MGWFDRKIYFYFQHSHALTLSRSHFFPASTRPRIPASSFSSAFLCSPCPSALAPFLNNAKIKVTIKITVVVEVRQEEY